jgi:PAS domain S-box-containing protein
MREIPDIEETVATADVFGSSLLSLVSLVDNAPDVISRFDRAGRYLFISQAAERYTGIPREAFLGKKYRELGFPEEVCQLWDASLRDTFATGDPTRIEFSVPLPVLGVRHYEGHSVAERAADGTIVSVLTVTRDISERKDAEEQSARLLHDLMEERETLDRINAIGRLLSAELDLDRLVQAATDAATELTGAQFGAFFYNVENEQGESYLLYTISGVPREAFSRFPMPRATHLFGPTFRGEGIIRIGDVLEDARYGQMAPYHGMPAGHLPVRSYLALPVLSRSGQVLGGLFFGHAEPEVFTEKAERNVQALVAQLAVAMDNARLFREALRANEEARIAEERRASAEALRQSEERFRLLVEQVRDYAIFMLNPEGYIATWNEGAARFKGYSADEIIGQHFSRFYTQEDIDRRHPWNELEIAAREGRYEEEGWRLRKDGSRFWANVVITALRDEKGRLQGFGKVTRDMTERRAREQERAAAQVAEQQRRLLREMLASVTEGRLTLCETRNELPERLPLLADQSEDEGRATIPLDRLTLRRLRRRTAEAARLAGLDKDRGNDLLTAVSEAAMNAVVHAGGGTATIAVDPEVSRVQVWIEDHGTGIDMRHLPQATLDRGYTTAGTLGHGFKMVLATAEKVWLLTGPTGTTVVIEQGRDLPKPHWLAKR